MESLSKHESLEARIDQAFEEIDRADFLPVDKRHLKNEDRPIFATIRHLNSQPTTVRNMLQLLAPEAGQNILDIGSGSGWTTALLAHMVGEEGSVTGVERVQELVSFGQKNLRKYPDIQNAKIFQANRTLGFKEKALYDGILVSAGIEVSPEPNTLPPPVLKLLTQLHVGGTLVAPIGKTIANLYLEAGTRPYMDEEVRQDIITRYQHSPEDIKGRIVAIEKTSSTQDYEVLEEWKENHETVDVFFEPLITD